MLFNEGKKRKKRRLGDLLDKFIVKKIIYFSYLNNILFAKSYIFHMIPYIFIYEMMVNKKI